MKEIEAEEKLAFAIAIGAAVGIAIGVVVGFGVDVGFWIRLLEAK